MQEEQDKSSFLYSMKSVLWAMLGVRANKGYDEDVKKITVKQAVFAGIIGVAIFITTLIFVVKLVISQAAG